MLIPHTAPEVFAHVMRIASTSRQGRSSYKNPDRRPLVSAAGILSPEVTPILDRAGAYLLHQLSRFVIPIAHTRILSHHTWAGLRGCSSSVCCNGPLWSWERSRGLFKRRIFKTERIHQTVREGCEQLPSTAIQWRNPMLRASMQDNTPMSAQSGFLSRHKS